MKELTLTLPDGATVRRTSDGRMSVFDLLKIAGAKNPRDTYKRLKEAFPDSVANVDAVKLRRSDGKYHAQPTPVCDEAGWRRIRMVLPGMMGASYRAAANDLIEKALRGDVQTAAAIAERNNNPRDLEWLGARALSKSTVLDLNGSIAAAGCAQKTYPKVHDTNNVAVTGLTAAEIQQERGVKQTRDGMDVIELGLMIALQGTQARQIRETQARGDGQVLSIVSDTAQKIAGLRRSLLGPREYPNKGMLTVPI